MKRANKAVLYGLIIAVIFVIAGTFILYESNETLDIVAESLGLEGINMFPAPFPDYTVPGLDNIWAVLTLGILSTLVIFAVAYGIGKLLAKIKTKGEVS